MNQKFKQWIAAAKAKGPFYAAAVVVGAFIAAFLAQTFWPEQASHFWDFFRATTQPSE